MPSDHAGQDAFFNLISDAGAVWGLAGWGNMLCSPMLDSVFFVEVLHCSGVDSGSWRRQTGWFSFSSILPFFLFPCDDECESTAIQGIQGTMGLAILVSKET